VGESINAFAWRLEQSFDGELPHRVLAYKLIQGMTPNIRMAMPPNKVPWTFERIIWFGENLDKFLDKDDAHWREAGKPLDSQNHPDLTVKVTTECATLPLPSAKEVEAQPKKSVKDMVCYRCQEVGHYAYEHRKKVKSVIQRVKPAVRPPSKSTKKFRRRSRGQPTRVECKVTRP
jgi:hypothetical protein